MPVFVRIEKAKEGLILASDIYDSEDNILLRRGTVLKSSYIKRLREKGYNGVYVQNTDIGGIVTVDPIRRETRIKTVNAVRRFFNTSQKNVMCDEKNLKDLKKSIEDIISELLENKDIEINLVDLKINSEYTFFHSVNVAVISLIMGIAKGYSQKNLFELGLGALLHDIGKLSIDRTIVEKPGQLDDEEFKKIKEHPEKGFSFLRESFEYGVPVRSRAVVLQHHEKYDGTGYPRGLKKDEIHPFARLVAVADVYDAMTSDRPYRKALPPHEVIEFIMGSAGTHFDPDAVSVFLSRITPYPVGSIVQLSDGTVGTVIEVYSDAVLRPKLKVLRSSKWQTGLIIDLRNDTNFMSLTITKVLEETAA